MRILYCIPHLYNSGGMERVLTQKVNWLAAHTEHEITILTTEPVPAGTPKCYFPLSEKVQVEELNIDFNADYTKPLLSKYYAHMRRMSAYKRALTKYIRTHKIDLCISLGGKEIAFLRHLPCRTIAEMHFAMDQRKQLLMANHTGAFWSLLGAIRTRQLVRDVKPLERLVVLTEADKAAWEKAGCTNVTVIPNPCALNSRKSKVESRKTKTVLAVGRLHEQKGFDLLLRSWQPVEKHYPEWQLRIVGEGPKRAELETQVRELDLRHAIIAGRTENVADEYSSASLFVLSSRYEGFSLVLAEAMWCGTPCVAFDCPQGPAELLADGRGWLVPANDVEKLTQQIEYALAHPDEASARAAKAQAFAQATYSEAAIMPQWEKVIDNWELNKRILYINESLNTGSTGHIVEETASAAIKNGYECIVAHGARYVHVSQIPHVAFSSRMEEYAHGLYSLLCNAHGLGSESATKRLIRFIQEWQPSLIHLHNIHGYYLNYPLLFSFLKTTDIPVVWTLHDCWAITGRCAYFTLSGCNQWKTQCKDCPGYSDYPRSLLKAHTERNFVLKKQAFSGLNNMCITTVSGWLREQVQQSFLQGYPCRTIYNGIDTEVFQPTVSALREQWKAEDKVVILGVASQWTETKGWKEWIQLAQRLDKNRYTVVMVGVSKRQQQELPDHCVVISKTDNRTQLAQVYSAADIYVNLAHQEAFGLTLLEAMACGTPCISYNNTAIPETTTSEAAVILPDRDVDAVLREIEKAGREWKQQCSGECRNHVLTRFNNNDKIQEYSLLYGELTAT